MGIGPLGAGASSLDRLPSQAACSIGYAFDASDRRTQVLTRWDGKGNRTANQEAGIDRIQRKANSTGSWFASRSGDAATGDTATGIIRETGNMTS
ncbi:hypothetical protein VPH35_135632 [Triticum aestivum]